MGAEHRSTQSALSEEASMIEAPYICIVRGDSREEIERQKRRWRSLGTGGLVAGQMLDISRMTTAEASQAILKASQAQQLERVAAESLAALSGNMTDAVALASVILGGGARLFVVSYAVNGTHLIEIDRRLLRILAEYDGEFKPVRGDDVLFLAGYAKKQISLENLHYHLSALEETLKTTPGDLQLDQIATEIRRIDLLVQVMQRQTPTMISSN